MRKKHLFWGAFLLTCGIILLAYNFINIDWDFGFFIKFWPVVLIFGGISLLKINDTIKKIIAILNGVLLALFITSGIFAFVLMINNNIPNGKFSFSSSNHNCANYESVSNITKSIKMKNTSAGILNLDVGASSLLLKSGTENLIDMYTDYGALHLDYDTEDTITELNVEVTPDFNLDEESQQKTHLVLNDSIPWSMNIDCGATSMDLDLSNLQIKELELNIGMSDVKLTLGDKQKEAVINVNSGMSNMSLYIPENVGCVIYSKKIISNHCRIAEVGTIWDIYDDKYITKNYDTAEKKITIYLSGAFSSSSVDIIGKEYGKKRQKADTTMKTTEAADKKVANKTK